MKVKNIPLVLLLVVLHYSNCHSQLLRVIEKAEQIEISVGPSWVTLISKDYGQRQPLFKIGYSAKLGLDYKISKSLALNVGLLYEQKGNKDRSTGYYYDPSIDSTNCKCTTSVGRVEDNVNRNYVELSLAPKFRINNIFYLSTGIFLGYLLKVNVVEKFLWNNSSSHYSPNLNNSDTNRLDGGFNLSIGYAFKIGKDNSMSISVNEFFGIRDISQSRSSSSEKATTNSLSLRVGYILKSTTT